MKVIQILPELNAGGVERGTLEVADALVRNGHDSIVVSNGGRLVPTLEAAGSRHITLQVHRKHPASLPQVLRLRSFFQREKPDIIHLRSRLPAWLAFLAWKSLPTGMRPHLVTTVHGFYSANAYSAVMTRGERIICVSESVRDYVLTHYPDTDPGKLRVIHRGVDESAYHPGYRPTDSWFADWHRQHPTLSGKAALLLPGRITRLKGHEEFFSLIAALNARGIPAQGIIAGDTHPKKRAYLAELQSLATAPALAEHITFLGHRSDLRDVIAACDLTFSLSRQPESFGRTTLEAIALGKPVVGHDLGGVGEILAATFPAGLVPLHDADALLTTVIDILRNRPCPAAIPPSFTLANMCDRTLELYGEISASD